MPPRTWPENESYKEGLKIVNSLKVTNDAEEQGIKLIQDFNNILSKDEEQKQFILQVASECRKLYPDASNYLTTEFGARNP